MAEPVEQERENPTVLLPTIPRKRMGIELAFSPQSSHVSSPHLYIPVPLDDRDHLPFSTFPCHARSYVWKIVSVQKGEQRNLGLGDVREEMRWTRSSQAADIGESGEELYILIFSRQAAQHLQHITESYLKIPRGVLHVLLISPLILCSGSFIKMFASLAQLTIMNASGNSAPYEKRMQSLSTFGKMFCKTKTLWSLPQCSALDTVRES